MQSAVRAFDGAEDGSWCGAVRCGAVRYGAVWCGVVWYLVCHHAHERALQKFGLATDNLRRPGEQLGYPVGEENTVEPEEGSGQVARLGVMAFEWGWGVFGEVVVGWNRVAVGNTHLPPPSHLPATSLPPPCHLPATSLPPPCHLPRTPLPLPLTAHRPHHPHPHRLK